MTAAKPKTDISQEVADLVLEAVAMAPSDPTAPGFDTQVKKLTTFREDLRLDDEDRAAPYSLRAESKALAVEALAQIQVPVTHPNWLKLTEVLVKARVQLGIVED